MPVPAFADDLYLLGSGKTEKEHMARELVEALGSYGLALQPDECAWFAAQHDSADTELTASAGDNITRVERMRVLGTLVEVGGDPVGAAVAHRTQRAWASWYALRPLLTLRSPAVKDSGLSHVRHCDGHVRVGVRRNSAKLHTKDEQH